MILDFFSYLYKKQCKVIRCPLPKKTCHDSLSHLRQCSRIYSRLHLRVFSSRFELQLRCINLFGFKTTCFTEWLLITKLLKQSITMPFFADYLDRNFVIELLNLINKQEETCRILLNKTETKSKYLLSKRNRFGSCSLFHTQSQCI